jgi:hypothetical protein
MIGDRLQSLQWGAVGSSGLQRVLPQPYARQLHEMRTWRGREYRESGSEAAKGCISQGVRGQGSISTLLPASLLASLRQTVHHSLASEPGACRDSSRARLPDPTVNTFVGRYRPYCTAP